MKMTVGSQKGQLRLSRRIWQLPLWFLAVIHCTPYKKAILSLLGMADQLMFGDSDMPSSSFKLNWAFGHSWPGENAHAGVFVPVSQT